MANVSLTDLTQSPDIERQRQLANYLQQQAIEPIQIQSYNGIQAPISPVSILAKIMNAYNAANLNKKADEEEKAKKQGDYEGLVKALVGSPSLPDRSNFDFGGSDASGNIAPVNVSPKVAPEYSGGFIQGPQAQRLAQLMGNVPADIGQPIAAQMLAQAMKPKEPIKLGATDRLIDPSNYSELVKAAPNPNQPFNPDGTPNKAYQDYELAKARTGRQVTNLSFNTDRSFGSQLGENAAKILDASHSSALGGIQTIQTANQIRAAIDTGNVAAGPGTTAGQFFRQITGNDEKKLVATRETIQGLAKLSLAARGALKGQGQISDYEGRLLQKAASGDIDNMSVPEIRVIANIADRAARLDIQRNLDNVNRARDVPGSSNVVDFYNVDMPPAYAAPRKKSGRFTIESAD